MDISGLSTPALTRVLVSSGVTTLRQLVDTAGPDLSGTERLTARLGLRSLRVVSRSLCKWRTALTPEELRMLIDYGAGVTRPAEDDPFPALILAPDLEDCEGPLLECKGESCMKLDSASGKLLYRACVKALNKKRLNGRVDTPWREVLSLGDDAYRFLAVNKKLGLSGRPDRPVGCIGTCKIYRILGKTVVCYPIVFDLSDFYLSQDVMLLIDDIKNALQFIKQCWKMPGRPLFLVLIREDNIKGSRFNPVLDMLASFKKGVIGGVKVHVDRLQTLISGAVVEQLDFLRVNEAEIPEFKSFEELEMPKHSKVKRQTSTPNASDLEQQPEINIQEWSHKPTYEILQKFNDCECLASQAQLASVLLKKEGPDFFSRDDNLKDELERIYRQAGSRKLWLAVRCAAAASQKFAGSIAPHITTLLVHGKQVTLGLFGHDEEVISNPLSPGVIKDIIYSKCSPHGEREAVLHQELVIHIGWIISNNPELFNGMLKIRIGWIVQAMKHELQIRAGDMRPQDIYQMSPSDVKQLLLDVLQPQQTGRSWLNRRQIDGSLNRTPLGFYDRVWQILERTRNGIKVAGLHLPQQPTLSDMTMYEMNFSLLVEDTLKNIVLPEYRQIIVELLMVVSIVLERNPELEFQETVDLDHLVKEAFADFQKDRGRPERADNKEDMELFYNTPPLGKMGTSSYLTKAVMIQLLQGEVKPSKDDPCSVS
ncbi:phosphorylase b kinase regulatory subunit beta-like [Hoplias malabaricus]|uniref:phosphorylase b kinase regulatory subunit beta-like n=1 Tax=Hoplias malabaricus TaxID=27720 RepID=UPI00346294BD